MSLLFPDTSPQAERVLLDLLRRAPGWRKLEMVGQMNRAAREVMLAGLHRRYPDETQIKLRHRLAVLLLGARLASRAYGSLPNSQETDAP
jgi:hypothetical protein